MYPFNYETVLIKQIVLKLIDYDKQNGVISYEFIVSFTTYYLGMTHEFEIS